MGFRISCFCNDRIQYALQRNQTLNQGDNDYDWFRCTQVYLYLKNQHSSYTAKTLSFCQNENSSNEGSRLPISLFMLWWGIQTASSVSYLWKLRALAVKSWVWQSTSHPPRKNTYWSQPLQEQTGFSLKDWAGTARLEHNYQKSNTEI